MRAVEPVDSSCVTLEGFRIGYETFGDRHAPALLFMPPWQIITSRIWKMQVPYFSRSYRAITFDGAGHGMGERAEDPAAFAFDRIVEQSIGLLDHLAVEQAAVVAFSRGCAYALAMAARYPERVTGLVLITNGVTPTSWGTTPSGFRERRETYQGWDGYNAHYWREHYDEWLPFFFGEIFSEPHSSKPIEDCIRWAHETTPEILAASEDAPGLLPAMPIEDALAAVQCPVLMIHGDDARCTPIRCTSDLAWLRPDWDFVTLEGCGQAPQIREPVKVNLLMADFLESAAGLAVKAKGSVACEP